MSGVAFIASGILLAAGTRWIGIDLARSHPCRFFFWLRVIGGVPLYLLSAALMYRGAMLL